MWEGDTNYIIKNFSNVIKITFSDKIIDYSFVEEFKKSIKNNNYYDNILIKIDENEKKFRKLNSTNKYFETEKKITSKF